MFGFMRPDQRGNYQYYNLPQATATRGSQRLGPNGPEAGFWGNGNRYFDGAPRQMPFNMQGGQEGVL